MFSKKARRELCANCLSCQKDKRTKKERKKERKSRKCFEFKQGWIFINIFVDVNDYTKYNDNNTDIMYCIYQLFISSFPITSFSNLFVDHCTFSSV